MIDFDIYERIKQCAKSKGFSLIALADAIGVTRQTLNSTMKSPSYPTLVKISTALNIPMWELFASPEEVMKYCKTDPGFIAIIKDGDSTYVANTRDELCNIANRLANK